MTWRDSRRRRWLFRLTALGLAALALAAVELICRAAGWGRVDLDYDPFVGIQGVRPLFVLSADGASHEIPRVRQEYFRPASFPARKAPREFRVFCLGESTVQGNPWTTETAFSSWLELTLKAADDSRDWRVVNCGGVSYASYRLVPILAEILEHYQPDLIVLYTGQNEFLEWRSYERLEAQSPVFEQLHQACSQLQTYRTMRTWWSAVARQPRPATVLKKEVDALLDYQGGMQYYRRDDEWREAVVMHYHNNLLRLLAMAQDHRVPLLLCEPVVDFRGTPPFKFEPDASLAAEQLGQLAAWWDEAKQPDTPPQGKIALLRQALELDPRHAGLSFHLAKCLEALPDAELAREYYRRSVDDDLCPLRMISAERVALREAAARFDTPLIDAQRIFDELSPLEMAGDEWLIDHVHPNIEGQQKIADAIWRKMLDLRLTRPPSDGWRERQQEAYRQRFASLTEAYFARGQQRLEGLRIWASGRAKKIRGPESP